MAASLHILQFSIVILCFISLSIFLLLEKTSQYQKVPTTGSILKSIVKKRDIESLQEMDSRGIFGNSTKIIKKLPVKVTSRPYTKNTTATTKSTSASPRPLSSTTKSPQQDINKLNKWNQILKSQLEAKRSVIKYFTKHVINHHDFEYVRNPVNACVETKPEILFVVLSAPGNFELRERIRNGDIGEYVRTTFNGAKLLFFTGAFPCNANATKLQTKLSDEYHNFGDIVQEDFLDVFQNLRLKAVSMLRWTFTYCSDVKYVIRMDDDVVVNVPTIVKVMATKLQQYSDFVVGSVRDDWRSSRRRSIPYRPEEDYSNMTLPRFVLGQLQGYPPSTVALLYHAAVRTEPISLEDVFITGLCASVMDIPLLVDRDFVFQHIPIRTND